MKHQHRIGRGRGGRFERNKIFNNKRKMRKEIEEKEMEATRTACENIDSGSVKIFKDLPLSNKTLLGLQDSGYTEPTEIQRESLCLSLRGLDLLGAAKTGSGKTLAFIIPILEILYQRRWSRDDGVGALVITPTRELAYQIFETLKKVGCHHDFSAGLIIGGKDLHFEKSRMHACNIVICTPGRLLQHMDENPLFTCDNLQILVMDEADRCLDMGFERTMNSIIENLPINRQTLLFSATQTKSIRDLARLSLKDPMYVSVHEHAKHSTPEGLQQSYVVCELHEKIDMLWSFIRNHRHQKILVFLTSCKQVKYHYKMFCHLRPGVSILALYGTLHQLRRMAIYEEFCRKQSAVLFATDIAARGLDFPEVKWVLQLDCPEDANTYIHRAGRTARYQRDGESLLVLVPSEEEAMIEQLQAKKIPINKIRINPKKLQSPLRKMEALLAQDPELKADAQRAFVSYLKAVFLMKNKSVFNIHALNTGAYSRSLGLAISPKIRFLKKAQRLLQQKTEEAEMSTLFSDSKNSDNDVKIFPKEEYFSTEDVTPTKGKEVDFSLATNGDDSDSESGDDLLQIKRKNHELNEVINSIEISKEISQKKKKFITKASVAKKILKKRIVANKKVIFNEDGEAVVDKMKQKVSEAAREYESENVGGIDIEKAKLILKEEDKFDKQLFREKVKEKHKNAKLKLKKSKSKKENYEEEEESEEYGNEEDTESEPDLSWLPDPDKIYGPKQEDSDVIGEDNKDDSEEENLSELKDIIEDRERFHAGVKRKKNLKHTAVGIKKPHCDEFSNSNSNLTADEDLALHLLKYR